MALTETRSDQDLAAVARFKQLTETDLPLLAREQQWPIRFDHCFKRICLDWTFGCPWYERLARPAERHLQGQELGRAVRCAEELVAGGLPVLLDRDAASLRWRGKRAKRHGAGGGAPTETHGERKPAATVEGPWTSS